MDLFGGQTGASASFIEYETKSDLSNSRMSLGRLAASPFSSPPLFSPSSSSSSPAPSSTAPLQLPTIFDQLAQWFKGIMGRRKVVASSITACTSVAFFYLLAAFLQASLWHPLASLYGALSLLGTALPAAIVVWAASFITVALLLSSFAQPDTPRRQSLLRSDAWAVTALIGLTHGLAVYLAAYSADAELGGERVAFVVLGVAAAAAYVVFQLDYRLAFSMHGSNLSLALWECVSLEGGSPLRAAANDVVRLYKGVVGVGAVAGSLCWGAYATLTALLAPSLHATLALAMLGVAMLGRVAVRVLREVVMQPVSFPLPPPHAIRAPTPAQTRTLLNVLDAEDRTLKLFAFTDLCRLARTPGDRRLEMFSLSQPGGHPRNWTAVRNACMRVIEDAKSKIDGATRTLTGRGGGAGDWADESDDVDDAVVDRQMLLMPERIRQQVYSTAVRSRHVRSLRAAAATAPRPPTRPSVWERVKRFVEVPTGVLTRYEAVLVQLAVESMQLLIVASFDEDRYGVVQRDLAGVLRALLQTIEAIDAHYRVRNARASDAEEDAPLRAVDDALRTAIYRVRCKFGDSLRSLELTGEEMDALDEVC